MITTLEHLGNIVSPDHDDANDNELSKEQVVQWLCVVAAVANTDTNRDTLALAVGALNAQSFGSDIVRLTGSLRNAEVVKHISHKVQWNTLVHNTQTPTTKSSEYHRNSYRNRLLANLTEQSFWIRAFGSDEFETETSETFNNIAFVFHTTVEQGSFSFHHPVHSNLFGRCVPFGTAVLAHQLGERYYIFEDAPFSKISVEHQADFFIAGCLHLGAREDHLDPEERTLGEGRLPTLLNTMGAIDINGVYEVSDYLCHTLGWPLGTQCPLGVVGLALLAGTPIHSPSSVAFAQQLLTTLTSANKEEAFSLLCGALVHVSSWDSRMGKEQFGPINTLIVDDLMQQQPEVVRRELLAVLGQFEQMTEARQNGLRRLLMQACHTSNAFFSLDDAPHFLSRLIKIFDVTEMSHLRAEWGPHTCYSQWWSTSFDRSLTWFDAASELQIRAAVVPYVQAMADFVDSPDRNERTRAHLVLKTWDPNRICDERVERKLKL